ncbi:MAG: DUF1080 domain-containing protein [Planctomycetota bacterium]
MSVLAIVISATVLLGDSYVKAASAVDKEPVQMFNGTDLSGWVVEGVRSFPKGDKRISVWEAKDGMIVCSGWGFGFLRFDAELSDFRFTMEYRLAKKGNSGVGIRGIPFTGAKATRPSFAGYEIQLLDDAGSPTNAHSSGSLYRYVPPLVNAVKPAGEWNTFEVECRGPKIRVKINGEIVQDVDQTTVAEIKDKPLRGYVSLQNHGHKVEFRNLQYVPLGTE